MLPQFSGKYRGLLSYIRADVAILPAPNIGLSF
jgi:hypothetical protein